MIQRDASPTDQLQDAVIEEHVFTHLIEQHFTILVIVFVVGYQTRSRPSETFGFGKG